MAATATAYNHAWKLIATGGLDLDTSELRVRLVTSGYTFSASHTQWDNGANDSTDPSFSEVANGNGYTTGGKQLLTPAVTNTDVDYADVTWESLTKTFRGVVCVAVGTFGGVVDPVIFYLLPDSTPADTVVTDSNYSILWNATNKVFYKP